MPKFAKVWLSMSKNAKICPKKMPNYALVCIYMSKNNQIFKLCQSMKKVCNIILKYAKAFLGMPYYDKICKLCQSI